MNVRQYILYYNIIIEHYDKQAYREYYVGMMENTTKQSNTLY